MDRHRRRFLRVVAGAGGSALFAGCTDRLRFDDSPQRPPAQVSTDPNADADADDAGGVGGSFEQPTIVDFETAPLTAVVNGSVRTDDGLVATLDFVEPATSSSPATLAAVVENGRSYEQTFEPGRLVVLDDSPASRSSGDAAYLAPAADHPLAETAPPFSRDDDGRWRLDSVRDEWFPDTLTLEAEEQVECEYYLLGHYQRDSQPIQAGRYRFGRREGAFTVTVWPTAEPGPDGDSRFDGTDVPAIPGAENGAMRWYHEATPETPVFLEPSRESVAAPARIEFSLVNHGDERLSGNPHQWRLYKLVDGAWHSIAPWAILDPFSWVDPGTTAASELFLYDGDPIDREDARTIGHLGGGRYAYTVGYSAGSGTHAALFDLEAPEIRVDPEADAVIDEDGGDTLVVRLPNYEAARRPATVTIDRADSSDDAGAAAERLVPEQLPRRQFRSFRNSLPLFDDGVDRVLVRTDRSTALGWFGYDEGVTRTVAYDGELFEATGSLESE
ncbi:hypothetical protein [Natrialba asiatica]|uniref:Lipoprotein n=1 Tax=Natrialba asiatica (strain ATCC 700177 / DSM 12278 / JCM 9576 / FERM P-10747 / NBRC 102637 / 172P1) TaxID=29540 RepID=M0AJJ6_NATA1|nr:hypothetical protein [Natrialba asiatica]ELY98057.1 hypothetical protein C481_19015 [Natrialba asiatica DSM 12278]